MEINRHVSILSSFRNKQTLKSETIERTKKIRSEVKTDSGKDTLIQLSDYVLLKAQSAKFAPENYTPLSTPEQAQEVLDSTKLLAAQYPSEITIAQTINNPNSVFYLLG